jgi:hypothetical protein
MKLLTIEQLAELLHRTPSSIRTDRNRNPERLPPSFNLPGSRKVLYKADIVENWLDELAKSQIPQVVAVEEAKPCRGRPTIASKIGIGGA